MVNNAAPRATMACVRMPAPLAADSRSIPTAAPSTAATSRRTIRSADEMCICAGQYPSRRSGKPRSSFDLCEAATVDLYWDPFDTELDDDPHPAWRRLRDEAPVYRNDKHEF